ncbi:hypothetical protein CALCODRAFT_341927 [Calocera cornea HHB12733]|uniref:Uncharacterized protein n=1 Tax=Calocera cornea HHB12733 TaxID=1353952 RepID=A0A165EWP5_9BASI|nr:hypothetical protein CALCODRAFT_341927 [Calocera cornea HHB12733]
MLQVSSIAPSMCALRWTQARPRRADAGMTRWRFFPKRFTAHQWATFLSKDADFHQKRVIHRASGNASSDRREVICALALATRA